MEQPLPGDLWTAAGVILGFQASSFLWRIANEVAWSRESGNRDVTWLPVADMLNLISMVVLVFGVFIIPLLTPVPLVWRSKLVGLALLLFVGHCFALAGHYDLYNPNTKRSMKYFTFQERVVVSVFAVLGALYLFLISQT